MGWRGFLLLAGLIFAPALPAGADAFVPPDARAETFGDADRGAGFWTQCKGCHEIGAGARIRIGPPLTGLFGRRAGAVEGFAYSKSMARMGADGLTWNWGTLDAYVENPKALVSGTRMAYRGLKEKLAVYYEIVKNGGWPKIELTKKTLKKGESAPEIVAIKKRLRLTGDLKVADSSEVFNDTLEAAIKAFEERFGLTPSGKITESLITAMNVPAKYRLEQILMNMDRMRWLAPNQNGRLIVVNIPEFKMHVNENGERVFDMVVVVGKEGHNTMMFNGDLNQVVFSPHWNVPESIVKNEILPAMDNNPDYLASQNMEIVKNDGDYPVIRQLPGPGNALGKVKFLFPNSFNIYFHDTPSKSLFERDKRAFSHGCIRLKEPEKFANYVLKDQPEWTPEKISAAMNSGTEKFVKVKDPIPVVITYYTAWVDEQGMLHFRDDIYGHDARLAKKMFK